MRQPKAKRRGDGRLEALVAVAALAVGLGAGWLVGREGRPVPAAGGTVGSPATEREVRARGSDDAELVRADEAAPDAAHDHRRAVDPDADRDAAVEALRASDPLVAELSRLLTGEALLAAIGDDEARVAAFLMHLYLGLGDGDAALDLARRTNPPAGTWAQVGGLLEAQGRTKDAADAYAAALERAGRFAWEEPIAGWAQRLAALDPERGLAFLREHATGSSADPTDMRLALARSLAGVGELDQARDALLALVAENRDVLNALDALGEFDPELAESEMRRLIGLGRTPELHARLARLLAEQGRTDEALAVVEEAFETDGVDRGELFHAAIDALGGTVDDATIDAWIGRTGQAPDLLGQVGARFANQGDLERAQPYLVKGWQAQLDSRGYLSWLPDGFVSARPDAVRAMLASASEQAGDRDEVWGDVADHYWRLGETALALQAWTRANQLDPGDGEWTSKLAALAAGTPPF